MQTRLTTAVAAVLGLFLALGAVHASETPSDNNSTTFDMANPLTWFQMPGNNGQTNHTSGNRFFFHPLKPASWAAIASPQEHENFHMAMTNPATYTYYVQPAFYMEFMNPANYFAWINPASYKTFLDPATYNYWMTPNAYMHFINPDMYSGMLNMNSYLTWMNPANFLSWMDPVTYTQMMDPANFLAAAVPGNQPANRMSDSRATAQ